MKASLDHTYQKGFTYKHSNPYHDKLANFSSIVLRDHEGEKYKGRWQEFFGNSHPLCVEVGTGFGYFMREYCEKNPSLNFVGMDYRFKRSFTLAKQLIKLPQKNFCLLRGRGERLRYLFGDKEVSTLFCFFPDPWPKERHRKRRLVKDLFFTDACNLLKTGGKVYIKTDDEDYFDWMLLQLEMFNQSQKRLHLNYQTWNLWEENGHFLHTFKTKFEKIFLAKNIPIKAMELTCL